MRRLMMLLLLALIALVAGCGRPAMLGVDTAEGLEPGSKPPTARPAPSATPTVAREAPPSPTSAPAAPAPVALNTPFQLKIGETIMVGGLTISFDGISEDSRCPKDVNCFWSGAVTVDLTITTSDGTQQKAQLTRPNLPKRADRASYGNLSVQLLDVAPYPERHDRQIRQQDYVATLLVAPAGAPSPTSAPAGRATPARRP